MLKIAIASGKGGTGKTFVSTNLYKAMKRYGLEVGIVDCDAEVPNSSLFIAKNVLDEEEVSVFCPTIDKDKCICCGKCAEVCSYHAITCIPALGYLKLMPELCHACEACTYFCNSNAILPGRKPMGKITSYGAEGTTEIIEARLNEGEHSPVEVICKAIEKGQTTGWDYMIMDAPPGCSCPFVNTVKDANLIILVTEPTPFGLSDLKHTIDVLQKLNKTFFVIINRADLGNDNTRNYLSENHIELMAEIPFSEKIAQNYSEGKTISDHDETMEQLFRGLTQKILDYENSYNKR